MEVNQITESIKKYAEQELGAITEIEFQTAYTYAKRKLDEINCRYGTSHGEKYLALLLAETIQAYRLSRYCNDMYDLNKGRSRHHQETASTP